MALTLPANAQQTESWMSVGGSVEYSDNIDRIEEGGRDESTYGANLEFQVDSEGRRYDLTLDGQILFQAFENDTFDEETRGNAFGELIIDIASDRLVWVTQGNFDQVRVDITAPDTPDNRENFNIVRTGPQFVTRIGQRSELLVQGFYQTASYEDSQQDSTGLSGLMSFTRAVSARTDLSANIAARRVEFDQPDLFSSYDLQEAYIGWQTTGARTRVDIEAGVTEIHDNGIVEDGSLLRLGIVRDVSSRSSISLDGGSVLTGNEDALRISQQLRPDLLTQAQAANDEPFRLDYANLGWLTAGDRLVVELDGYWESRDFVVTNLDDRDRQGIRANMVQTVSERFAAGVFVEFIEESFADPTAGDFDEQIYGFRLFFRPAERYQFELVASNVQRDTDTPNLSFEENLVRLNVTYDVFGDRGVGVGRRVDR